MIIFHRVVKILCSLLSNICMGFAINIITILETRGDGFQFSDFTNPLSKDDSFNMYAIVGMLLFDSIFYMAIAW